MHLHRALLGVPLLPIAVEVSASEPSLGFEVTSGSCTQDGACAMSPNYPESYGDDQDCTLQVLSGGTINADHFRTEEYEDVLNIGGTHYSGSRGPNHVGVTTGQEISWHSDFSISRSGWRICETDSAGTPSPSAGVLGFALVSGDCEVDGDDARCVTSPNYPGQYGSDQQCEIRALSTEDVTATSFDTEACCDHLMFSHHLTVSDLDPGTTFSGSAGPDSENIAEGGEIRWVSDFSISGGGWRICAAAAAPAPVPVPGAPPTIAVLSGQCTSDGACASSPNYPEDYGNDQRCRMEVVNSDAVLNADHFHTEAYMDVLHIGAQSSDTSYSGEEGPRGAFVSVGEGLDWQSDFSISHSGWRVCASAAPVAEPPTGVFEVVSGECNLTGSCVTSPHFPHSYGVNQACRINVLADGPLNTVSFHLEDPYDYLSVGGTHYTGSLGPAGVYALEGMAMHFHSDYSISYQGFLVCLEPQPAEHVTPAPQSMSAAVEGVYCMHGCGNVTMAGSPAGYVISHGGQSSQGDGALIVVEGQCMVAVTQVDSAAGSLSVDGIPVRDVGSLMLGGGNHSIRWSAGSGNGGGWLAMVLPTTGGCEDFTLGPGGTECNGGSGHHRLHLESGGHDDDAAKCLDACRIFASQQLADSCCHFGSHDGEMGCYAVPGATVTAHELETDPSSTPGRAAACAPQEPAIGGPSMPSDALELVEVRAAESADAAQVSAAAAKAAGKRAPKDVSAEVLAAKVRPAKQVDTEQGASANVIVAAAAFASVATFITLAATGMRRRGANNAATQPLLNTA